MIAQEYINRKIIHVDMDAFYASVEQRDDPSLIGKPIAVGGGSRRGVITTASYEARKFGVKSAMPGYKAKEKCPQLIFVPPRFEVYKKVSQQIRKVFSTYTDLIEPLSLDEAFLDVTENKKGMKFGMDVAKQILIDVKKETHLTCSAGVSYCKFLAKVASGMNKPNGLTIIRPEQAEAFLEKLEIGDFFGIGKVTANKMKAQGINNGFDLKQFTKIELAQKFGKMGSYYFDIVRGIDKRKVNNTRLRKSIAVERTLENDLSTFEELEPHLMKIAETLYERLTKADNFGRTITLKLKGSEFQTVNRSSSRRYFIKDIQVIKEIALELLEKNEDIFKKLRLIGLTATNLEKELLDSNHNQLTLDLK